MAPILKMQLKVHYMRLRNASEQHLEEENLVNEN